MENQVVKRKLSFAETERLQVIFQRKMALLEILPTIKGQFDNESMDYLYEKVVHDLQQTNQLIHKWWLEVSEAHGWKYGESDTWNVNFKEQEVTIIHADSRKW